MDNSLLCPICNNLLISDVECGEVFCSTCGIVTVDRTEQAGPEWRSFNFVENRNSQRTGAPLSLARHDKGLYTVIGNTIKDASHEIDSYLYPSIRRLKTLDSRTQLDASTRNLKEAFSQLDRLRHKLGLSENIVEKVAYIYRKAHERKLVRGRTISGVLGAAVYIACREIGNPRTMKDIARAINVTHRELRRNYGILVLGLDLKVPLIDPMNCINRVANKIGISEKTRRHAMDLMSIVTERRESNGKNPMGLAATVLYLSSLAQGEYKTQLIFAEAGGVTEVTIRNLVKGIRKQCMVP
ncbi:MAG TPA: transcription initiation factor IIB [Nitrososphaeraceae archaeon]